MGRAEFTLVNVLAIALLFLLTLKQSSEAQTGARISFGMVFTQLGGCSNYSHSVNHW